MAQDQATTSTGASEFCSTTEAISCATNSSEVGDSVTGEASSPSALEYFSPRIERITQLRHKLSSDVEVEIKSSKEDWSEMSSARDVEDDDMAESNRMNFELLCHEYPMFFSKHYDYHLGRKLAEGGQAEIYEAMFYYRFYPSNPTRAFLGSNHVLKVFKKGSSLLDLQRQWPLGMMKQVPHENIPFIRSLSLALIGRIQGCCEILKGVLLSDGRFAFSMRRYWGDLRKLIDMKMEHNRHRGLPFKTHGMARTP